MSPSGWPRLRFCESPDLASATRLDLHNAGVHYNGDVVTLADGFSLGVPAVSSPPGARVQVLTDRTTTRLPLLVVGTKRVATRSLNLVMRELLRPTNWLEVQIAPELEPRWLRTMATVPEPLSLEHVYSRPDREDRWTTSVSLAAGPLALGPEELLGEWTVTNHPSSGVHPMRVELPEVEGEAPAPIELTIAKAAAGGMFGPAVGCARVPAVVSSAPGSWGAAVGSAVTDASMVAGTYRQTTGALASWTTVATWTPTGVPADYRRWLAMLRVDGSADAGALRLRWKVQAAGVASAVYSAPVTVRPSTQARWVRTGEVPVPMLDLSGLSIDAATTLTLEVQRITAGGELRFDAPLLLVPAGPDADLLALSPDAITSAVTVRIDGTDRRVGMAAGTAPTRTPGVAGGWPHVTPGQDNHLLILQSLDPAAGSGAGDSIASTTTVRATYRPRYVWGV